MPWKPIDDLPENWADLVSTEIESLAQAWQQNYQDLKDTQLLDNFNEKLRREWSIETGILERLYTIDRGTTQLLIEQGIDATFIPSGSTDRPVYEVVNIIRDQREALDGLFAYVKQNQPLTIHYIRSLHQVLLRHQDYTEAIDQFGIPGRVPLIKGDWKKLPNNPQRPDGSLHEYCLPEHVQSEMDKLVLLHNQHLNQLVSPQVEAAWLHHRFTQIHPFQDGNGRVARCLATMVFIRAGRFPLVINRDHRIEYISALEAADAGNLMRLVRLFDQIQKQAYRQALTLSDEILQPPPIDILIESITNKYQERQQSQDRRVFEMAEQLQGSAQVTMGTYAERMRQQFAQRSLPINVRTEVSNPRTMHWYQAQIVQTARKLGYFANLTNPRLWVRLILEDNDDRTTPRAEVVVSLHYFGKQKRGIMIASAFLDIIHAPDEPAGNETSMGEKFREIHALVTEGFIFTHMDAVRSEQQQREFQQWLEAAITVGLAEWLKQI